MGYSCRDGDRYRQALGMETKGKKFNLGGWSGAYSVVRLGIGSAVTGACGVAAGAES